MESSVFFCCLLLLIISEADTIITDNYVDIEQNDVVFEDHVISIEPAVSLVGCGQVCFGNEQCLAFTFTSMSQECRLYSKIMTSQDVSTPWTGARTFYKEPDDWRNQSCATTPECLGPYRECFKGQCKCTPGYYYSLSTKDCILECPPGSLQNGYMKYPQSEMLGGNLYWVDGTVGDCKTACSSEPQCLTFEYEWSADGTGKGCYLQDVTAVTYASGWRATAELWDMYQIHCA